jgi:DUF4097 and DUF4098 domain-containing protein YvlB
MPIFDTPEPITVTIDVSVGDVRITATDRTDTVVEVRPTDESEDTDVKAAKQTRVEYANGTLVVKGPKSRVLDFSKKLRSVDVTIELPTGSRVHGDASVGDFSSTGRLGECRFKTSAGHLRLDHTGPLRVSTSGGHVTVERAEGDAEISTGTGRVRVGEIDGTAAIKNSNGNTDLGTVTGDVQVRAANGDISINRALGGRVDAKTANGSIRVGEAIRGAVTVKTATGDLEVGITEGTAAWLDVNTSFGRVHNSLTGTTEDAAPSGDTVEVRAHTSFGDIIIRRA